MKKINLENKFAFFLESVGLNADVMPADQLQERKIAFYAGMSQMWRLLQELSELPEADCVTFFEDIESQLSSFWQCKATGL